MSSNQLQVKQTQNASVFLGFSLLGNQLLMSNNGIEAVVPVVDITTIPMVKPWMRGITQWHGQIVYVLDINELIGANQHRCYEQTQMIVVEEGGFHYGLLVEKIKIEYHVAKTSWQNKTHEDCAPEMKAFVHSHVIIEGVPWHLFDLQKLFQYKKLSNLSARITQ